MRKTAHLLGIAKMYFLDCNNFTSLHNVFILKHHPYTIGSRHPESQRAARCRSYLLVASLNDNTKLTLAKLLSLFIVLHASPFVTSCYGDQGTAWTSPRRAAVSLCRTHGEYMMFALQYRTLSLPADADHTRISQSTATTS